MRHKTVFRIFTVIADVNKKEVDMSSISDAIPSDIEEVLINEKNHGK